MYDDVQLAQTGFGLSLFGVVLDTFWVVVLGFTLIMVGLIALRMIGRRFPQKSV